MQEYTGFFCFCSHYLYSFLRLGFLALGHDFLIGNQPLRTRSRCLKTSPILQKEEKAKMPKKNLFSH